MYRIKVADIVIEFEANYTDFWDQRLKDYLVSDDEIAETKIRISLKDSPEKSEGEVIYRLGNSLIVRRPDGKLTHEAYTKNKELYFSSIHAFDYSTNDVKIIPEEKLPRSGLKDFELEYLQSGFAFTDRLVNNGGTSLHGSGIAIDGNGIIFSAPPGTGKSTHTNLWKKIFKDRVVHINDDKPAIKFEGETPFMYGTPWCGKTDINTNIKVPLKAIVFLRRGEKNSIKRLPVAESIMYLHDQTFPPYFDDRLVDINLKVIERLVMTVPIYELKCNISDEAVYTSYNGIFKEDQNEN